MTDLVHFWLKFMKSWLKLQSVKRFFSTREAHCDAFCTATVLRYPTQSVFEINQIDESGFLSRFIYGFCIGGFYHSALNILSIKFARMYFILSYVG